MKKYTVKDVLLLMEKELVIAKKNKNFFNRIFGIEKGTLFTTGLCSLLSSVIYIKINMLDQKSDLYEITQRYIFNKAHNLGIDTTRGYFWKPKQVLPRLKFIRYCIDCIDANTFVIERNNML